jgi:hypothetical protein
MKKVLNILILFMSLFPILNLRSQNEASKWYFGNKQGVDFLGNPPVALFNSSLVAGTGCASIADASGNFLFSTNGTVVLNANQQIMANGGSLMGSKYACQSSLIVKRPGSSNKYYIFTLDQLAGANGLRYSEVDLSLAAGLGSVTTLNIPLWGPSMEKMTGTKHCNGTDFWIVTHDYGNNNFHSYLVSAAGVNTVAVISSIGSAATTLSNTLGYLKLSPNGKKIGHTMQNGTAGVVEVFDFDNGTGVVSNSLSIASNLLRPYGFEFSPDGTKVYAGHYTNGSSSRLLQWDLCAGSSNAIINSQYIVATVTSPLAFGAIQNAPDGKLYVSQYQNTLAVISNPNFFGSLCNFSSQGITLATGLVNVGLPNFISGTIKEPINHSVGSSGCHTATFTTGPVTGCTFAGTSVTGLSWNFGDPGSGSQNISTLPSTSHYYSSFGNYTVNLMIYHGTCAPDTLKKIISITGPSISVTTSSTNCSGVASATAFSSGGSGQFSYSWTPSAQTSSIASGLTAGLYTIVISDNSLQCTNAATIQILPAQTPTVNVSGKLNLCLGETTTLTATGASNYTWSTGSSNSIIIVSPSVSTGYSVIAENPTVQCQATYIFSVAVSKCAAIREGALADKNMSIYPNPCAEILTVENRTNMFVTIYDLLGSVKIKLNTLPGKTEMNL